MNSVNHQQYAPYHANYEMPPKPASTPSEGNAEARANANCQSDSTPPCTPMTPQQRGQLSTHYRLMNDSLRVMSTPQPSLLEQMQPAFKLQEILGMQGRVNVSDGATPQPSLLEQMQPAFKLQEILSREQRGNVSDRATPQPSLLKQMQPAFDSLEILGMERQVDDLVRDWAAPQPM